MHRTHRFLSQSVTKFTHSDLYVPKHSTPPPEQISQLRKAIQGAKRLLVITGAGVSTESGIPDYRSEEVGRFARSNSRPVKYQEFVKSELVRKRYWARNYVGWPVFREFLPNENHRMLANHRIHGLITQNVDHLHQKAGSENVCELHGSNHRVVCMSCNGLYSRQSIQEIIETLNASMSPDLVQLAPDGDADISESLYETFVPPPCPGCGQRSSLRPHVVFFGDNVPKHVKEQALRSAAEADVFLVLGSTLQTYSSFQHVRQAKKDNKPVYIVNIGETRADDICDMKISAKCSDVLKLVL